MSDDRMEGRIAFIIEQQATFSEEIGKLTEQQQRLAEQQKKDDERHAEQHAHFAEDMLKLKGALLSLVNIVEVQGEQIKALAEQGRETDARLNVLVNVVERFIA